jgi:hypothetical protein
LSEDGRGSTEHVGAGLETESRGFAVDPAVDRDIEFEPSILHVFACSADLRQHVVEEGLTRPARVDRHDVENIDLFQKGDRRIECRLRIYGKPGPHPEIPRPFEHGPWVGCRLEVPHDRGRTGFGELFRLLLRLGDHQVTLQRQIRDPAKSLHDDRSDGDGRDEVAVHDVDVQ